MIELPDVNVVVAMFSEKHPHYEVTSKWFEEASSVGWALCPLTIAGFLRVASRPGTTPVSNLSDLRDGLEALIQKHNKTYHYWRDDVSLLDERLFDLSKIQGYRQLSDLHLLGIALQNNGTLVTMDTGIPQTLNAVRRPPPHLLRVLEEGQTGSDKAS